MRSRQRRLWHLPKASRRQIKHGRQLITLRKDNGPIKQGIKTEIVTETGGVSASASSEVSLGGIVLSQSKLEPTWVLQSLNLMRWRQNPNAKP
jgi:hypothetical protein